MNKVIVVAEPLSTAFGYIKDIKDRGYEPVILTVNLPEGYSKNILDEKRKQLYSTIDFPIRIIKESENYQETLNTIRALDPILVIPGCEEGVIIGTRLADDLGLRGNSYRNIDNMTKKDCMHECLRRAGIRYIRGKCVYNESEAIQFYDSLGVEDVVVKHPHSCATVGLHFCHGKEAMLKAFREEIVKKDWFGEDGHGVILQECILGTEYVVNTISCDGKIKISSAWKYEKRTVENEFSTYVVIETLEKPNKELLKYAMDTVSAIGIKNGPVHGEYMIDEKGPVLMEVNCRVMGGYLPSDYLDLVYGHHETDIALDTYLHPNLFNTILHEKSTPIRKGCLKYLISKLDMKITSSPIISIMKNLKSFYSGNVLNAKQTDEIKKTIDLETVLGVIYMVHDDERVVNRECDLLCKIEKTYPELFYTGEAGIFNMQNRLKQQVCPADIPCEAVLNAAKTTADISEGCSSGLLDIDSLAEENPEELLNRIFAFCKNIKVGGTVYISCDGIMTDADNKKKLELILDLADVHPVWFKNSSVRHSSQEQSVENE